jgi:hypothetical protein
LQPFRVVIGIVNCRSIVQVFGTSSAIDAGFLAGFWAVGGWQWIST